MTDCKDVADGAMVLVVVAAVLGGCVGWLLRTSALYKELKKEGTKKKE